MGIILCTYINWIEKGKMFLLEYKYGDCLVSTSTAKIHVLISFTIVYSNVSFLYDFKADFTEIHYSLIFLC